MVLLIGCVAALLVISALVGRPNRSLVLLLLVAGGLPYWASVSAGVRVPLFIATLALVLAVLGIHGRVRLGGGDLFVGALALLAITGVIVGGIDSSVSTTLLGQWVVAFGVGRLLGVGLSEERIGYYFSLFGVVIACFTLAEFALDWHPFVERFGGNTASITWSSIQERAGLPRSEWTFGHSIALGNVLAMCVPFVLSRESSSWFRYSSMALIGSAIVVTFSRNALVALAMSLVLWLFLLSRGRSGRSRRGKVVVLGLVIAAPLLFLAVGRAGGTETAESSSFRLIMFRLLGDIKIFGGSGTDFIMPDGTVAYISTAYDRGYTPTIDNTFVLLGLQAGWLAVAVVVGVIAHVAVLQLRGNSRSPAGVAVLAQVPTIMTVAMITQYASFFWLFCGIAISASVSGRPGFRRNSDEADPVSVRNGARVASAGISGPASR